MKILRSETDAFLFPTSFAQQRLWFIDSFMPGSALYNVPAVMRLGGGLDVRALEKSLNEIVQRHEVLRTSFVTVDGQPMQLIAPSLDLPLPVAALQQTDKAARDAEVKRLAAEETRRPFDLTHGPLMRASLLRLAEEEHVLFLTMHHIVSDGWSIGVLYRELEQLYRAYSAGLASPLPELPMQYAHYAILQGERLKGEVLDEQLAYWKHRLAGAPPLLELPADYPRPQTQTFSGARETKLLPKRLISGLRQLARTNGATLFMALLSVSKLLLARYARTDDIVVGLPIAGRTLPSTENLVGLFVNTLVLRTDCSGDPSFLELLSRVRATAVKAYEHQDLPFEKLVEELKPERSLSYSPLFQVLVVKHNKGWDELNLSGLQVAPLDFERDTAKFDLSFIFIDSEEGFKLIVEYNTDLFATATISRLIGHFGALLEGVLAQPEAKLSQLPLLTEAERKQLVVAWNETRSAYPSDATIASLFQAQVRRTPSAPALAFEDEELSYAELNARANRLAHHLRAQGVGPETLVGVCAQRSSEMVAALLAILKAGGAYLPLDPNYPEERLAFMLEDGAVPVLLTQEGVPLPRQRAKLVYIDALDRDFASYPDTDPELNVEANNLAYVIYTSGSTGRPKGVAIEHRSAVALLSWATDTFAPEQWAGVLASTSICFDLSVFELFVPLSVGGTVVLVENVLQLPNLGCANKVTLVNTVPSAAVELMRVDGIPASVRTVNLAGEPLTTELVRELYDKGVQRVYDLYGPTEDTTYSTFVLRSREGRPTIGRPIANTQVYILDAYFNPVPIGVAGELHIGGAGLARGYLNRPELTAEKFIANPFSDDPNARLYKTGDLARYLPDGNIEFLGRIDTQVKVRGFRIELGEIEAVLAQHPNVKACAVIAIEDHANDKRLIAYIVPDANCPVASGDLRDFLHQTLPDYMLPSAFVVMNALPLTPNGKLDRKALPAPEYRSEESFVAPRTPTEEKLAAIWGEVLKLDRVGTHDNFFALGGHSLLATQVISRVKKTFDADIQLRALFESPTVANLAAHVAQAVNEGTAAASSTNDLTALSDEALDALILAAAKP